MKTNPVQDKNLLPGDDFIVLPEPQTSINISSKDVMNITLSKCCLAVLNNLAKVSVKTKVCLAVHLFSCCLSIKPGTSLFSRRFSGFFLLQFPALCQKGRSNSPYSASSAKQLMLVLA